MSGYSASCPSCGAPVQFKLGSSLIRVCEHCGVAVVRKGADVASYGKVAQLVPTPSVLALGLEGGYSGAPRFTLVGRLQMDHGSGTWDEWLLAFSNDTWSWLSEAQGRFHYMGRAPLPPVPDFDDVKVGQTIDLGPGVFVVSEVRSARFASATGELPFDVKPGSTMNYVDLSGPGGQFATLDYGTGTEAEDLYIGREVTLEELGIKEVPDEERQKRATAGALSCPQCGGPVEIRVPDETQRVTCGYCGSLLDATRGGLSVLEALGKVPLEPLIPLGSTGRFEGIDWTLIGLVERSVTYEGIRYPWFEYLLYAPRHGYRWLVDSKGHWSFVEPAHAGDISAGTHGAWYQGRAFKHFQGGHAHVDHVIGEFYWAVARGNVTETADYIDPPHMLSKEADGAEITWSRGTYRTPEEVAAAFGIDPATMPRPIGVGAHQPSPYAVGGLFVTAILASVFAFVLFLGLYAAGRQTHSETFDLGPGLLPGTPESAVFTRPFLVDRRGNVRVQVTSPVNNSWLYVDGALINEDTGELQEFDVEVSYYYGSEGGESWSEGGQSGSAFLPAVTPGTYMLRLAPQWQMGLMPPRYQVTVTSRVPRFRYFLLLVMGLFAWPAVVAWRAMRFAAARWSESDHPWGESE